MRPLTLLALSLLPIPAYACGWHYVGKSPLAFLWGSVFLASFAALLYGRRERPEGSRLPHALMAGAIIAGLGLGGIYGSSDWTDFSAGLLPAASLIIPWLGMRYPKKLILKVVVALVAVGGFFGVSDAFSGEKVGGFNNHNQNVPSVVVF